MKKIPCYHPIQAFKSSSVNPETGKNLIYFPKVKLSEKEFESHPDHVYIPCGNCIGCRLEYSRQWAIRCILEAKSWNDNYFLTLTYAVPPVREHVKVDENGEVLSRDYVSSLLPDDLTLFMKRLRSYYKDHYDHDNIRFFACGEYGDQYGRPHYHLILFNCPIYDLKVLDRKSSSNMVQYTSQTIEKIWKNGLISIGDVTFESSAYVARYIMKKHKGRDSCFYDENGLVPEFTRCSRRPGIGRSYFEVNCKKIYYYDSLTLVSKDGCPLVLKPPKYYDRIFEEFHPDDFKSVKEKRVLLSENSENNRSHYIGGSRETYLHKLEDIQISKSVSLKRS